MTTTNVRRIAAFLTCVTTAIIVVAYSEPVGARQCQEECDAALEACQFACQWGTGDMICNGDSQCLIDCNYACTMGYYSCSENRYSCNNNYECGCQQVASEWEYTTCSAVFEGGGVYLGCFTYTFPTRNECWCWPE